MGFFVESLAGGASCRTDRGGYGKQHGAPRVQLPPAPYLCAMPSWNDFQRSPHHPIVVTQNPQVQRQTVNGTSDVRQPVPLNNSSDGLIEFESDYFRGHMQILVRGLPSSDAKVFAGSHRLAQITIQGRWKQDIPADALWVGQQLLHKPTMPQSLLSLALHGAAKMFSSVTRVDATSSSPSYYNPFMAAADTVNVAAPGAAPPLKDAGEDCRLLGPAFVDRRGAPISAAARRRLFDTPAFSSQVVLSSAHTYTFSLAQSIVDMSTYRLSMGGWLTMDLLQYLEGQPLHLMLMNFQTQKMVFGLLVWHEKLVYPRGAPSLQQQQQCSVLARHSLDPASSGSQMDSSDSSDPGSQLDGSPDDHRSSSSHGSI